MRLLVGLGMVGTMIAAMAPVHAAEPDRESAQFMCDLTGDCADPGANNAAGSAPAPAAPAHGEPRSSAARGFTFQRATTGGAAAAARPATAAPVVVPPVQVGAANLRLTFLPASAELTEPAKAHLAKFAAVLDSPRLAARRVRIEGHTDASGSPRINLDLSRRRAQSVADYLVGAGVDRARVDVVGYGSSRPLPNTPATSPENRRVMAVLL